MTAVSFEDADLSDAHTVDVAFNGVTDGERPDLTDEELAALFTAGDVAQADGSTTRTFDLSFLAASTAFDYLAAGERVTLNYEVAIDDGNGGVVVANPNVVVTGTNDAPVAMDDAATTDHDEAVTIDVLANDTDVDNETLTVVAIDDSATAGLVIGSADGMLTYDPNSQFAFLAAGETAIDTFTYTISDGDLESTATVTVTIEGEDGIFNNGTGFTFQVNTNGDANRYTFDGEEFTVRGSNVDLEAFQDVDSLLVRAAELFRGVVENAGDIDDQALAFGGGPDMIAVTPDDEVTIGGADTVGEYQIQFDDAAQAETFRDFVLQLFAEIDENDAIAVDPEDFRFDAGETRVFYDKGNDVFGLTSDGGATQEQFDTLEEFVEGIAAELGGRQQRDGNFDADAIADGVTPSVGVFSSRVAISGGGVLGQFRFSFGDRDAAQDAGDAFRDIFAAIDEANIVAIGDEPGASLAAARALEFDENLFIQSGMDNGMFGLL